MSRSSPTSSRRGYRLRHTRTARLPSRPAEPVLSIAEPYAFDEWIEAPEGLPEAYLTIDRNGNDDVDRFRYQIDGGPILSGAFTAESATVSFVPEHGLTLIKVWLVDEAGNAGPTISEDLKILSPGIEHGWLMNEDTVGVAADFKDPAAGGVQLRFGADVTWAAGNLTDFGDPRDRALGFGGTGAAATADGVVIGTESSFTVATKVKLDQLAPAGTFVAVSQDAGDTSAFNLGIREGRWAAWGVSADGSEFTIVGPEPVDNLGPSGIPFPDGEPDWQHLALVYNATAGAALFYLDGDLVGSVQLNFGTAAEGVFRVGQGRESGQFVGNEPARVDDVIVMGSAVSESHIRELTFVEFVEDIPAT